MRLMPLSWLVLIAAAMNPATAQRVDTTSNPFAGFETRTLGNGLKVWFKQAKGLRDVAVSVAVPAGSDQDPVGKEQLAHFTEHMMFSDRGGLTEGQINRALEERGGTNNAYTTWDHTFYYAHVAQMQGLFALNWLYGIVSPKDMRRTVVDKQRDPVLIEVSARPPGIQDWAMSVFIDPRFLRNPGYWKREFGIETWRDRTIDFWRSTNSIDSADLRGFYDKYYVPAAMTLTIVGDLPADSVWRMVDTTFGTLASRPVAHPWPALVDPHREGRMFQWEFGSQIDYDERFKTFERSAHDDLALAFIDRYLSERLNNALRFGPHKAVYGISVSSTRRGRAGQFSIGAEVKKGELDYVRATVDTEVARLRAGTFSDSEFLTTRGTVTGKLRSTTNTAVALESWIGRAGLYDRNEFTDYPDFLTAMSTITKADVQSVAKRVFVRDHHYLSVTSLVPLPHTLAYLIIALLLFLTMRAARTLLMRPLPMSRLRYVARLKSPLLYRVAALAVYTVLVFFVLRVAIYLGIAAAIRWVLPIDSFVVQWALLAVVTAAGVLYLIGAAALIPTKLLVFDDGIAVKAFAYRSTWIPIADVTELSMKTVGDVVRERGIGALRATWLMTPALWSPALYLRIASGRAYFIGARDTSELLMVVAKLAGQPASQLAS